MPTFVWGTIRSFPVGKTCSGRLCSVNFRAEWVRLLDDMIMTKTAVLYICDRCTFPWPWGSTASICTVLCHFYDMKTWFAFQEFSSKTRKSKLLTHGCRERKRPRPPKFRERDDEREQRIEQKTLRVWRLLMWDWHILSAAGTLSRWWKLFSHFVSICGRIGHILMSSRHLKTLENPHGGVSCSTKKCHLCILLLKASLVQRWLSGQHAETKWLRQQTLQLLDICWRKLKSPCEG